MQLDNLRNFSNANPVWAIMEREIKAFDARRNFGKVLEEVYYKRDAFIITRSGREMAVILSVESYRNWQKLAKEMALKMIRDVRSRNKDVPLEEIEADIDAALGALKGKANPERQPSKRT